MILDPLTISIIAPVALLFLAEFGLRAAGKKDAANRVKALRQGAGHLFTGVVAALNPLTPVANPMKIAAALAAINTEEKNHEDKKADKGKNAEGKG